MAGGGLSSPAMSRRSQIEMDDAEVLDFLVEERTMICATNGHDGLPHLMPLWYVVRDGDVWAWTFGKSQKTRNLERDPRATVQVEAGDSYEQLRGVMLKTNVTVIADTAAVAELGLEILGRYGDVSSPEARAAVEAQAAKRVGLRFEAFDRATWDHRKLAQGVY